MSLVYTNLNLFNSIPEEIRNFPFDRNVSLDQAITKFKKKLDSYITSIPDEPNLNTNYTKFMSGSNSNGDCTNSLIRIHPKPI